MWGRQTLDILIFEKYTSPFKMTSETIVLLTIFVPIVGSLTIPLASLISKPARSAWAVLIGAVTSVLPLLLLPTAFSGGETVVRKEFILGLDFILIVDPLSIFMSIVSSFVGFLIIVYSLGYVHHDENQNEYYLMVILFIGSMMGLVYSGNLIFMYLFWEIIAICCWRLIGFYRLKDYIIKADKAFLVTFFGAVVMLLGFIQIYGNTNTFDVTAMRGTMIPGRSAFMRTRAFSCIHLSCRATGRWPYRSWPLFQVSLRRPQPLWKPTSSASWLIPR